MGETKEDWSEFMSIVSFVDKSAQCVFKLKTDDYKEWDSATKTQRLKSYYKKTRVFCHCCKNSREMIISSTKNQYGEKTYYLKRKPGTEEHHKDCYFSRDRAIERIGEDDVAIRIVLEWLIKDSMKYALSAKRKKGLTATTDDLIFFINAKLNELKRSNNNGYRLLADSYLEIPTFQAFEDKLDYLEFNYSDSQINPFTIGKIVKVEDRKDNCIIHVNTNRRNLVFKYSIPKSNVTKGDLEKLSQRINEEEVWIAGILTRQPKSRFITLKKVKFFYISHSGEFLSKKL